MKLTINKRAITLTLGISLMMVSGCDKNLLDQTNPNAITPDTFWRNEDDAKKAVVGAYSPFTDIWYYSRMEIFASDYRDDIVNGFGTSDRTNPGRFEGTAIGNVNVWLWTVIWKIISRSNEILANVPAIDMDETKKNNILGEAHFLRGLNYFNAVNNWRNIPLITEPIESIEASKDILQAAPEDVWNQIITDLKNAQDLLPPSWSPADIGRATSGAATAMLGKAYLYTEQYSLARDEFAKIMDGRYQLVDDYGDNFSSFSENNEESIFEIQFVLDDNRGWGGDAAGVGRTNSFTPDLAPRGFTGQDGMRINDWVLDLFLDERTVNGEIDPRAFNTLFWRTDETTTYEGETLAATIYEGKRYDDVYGSDENRVWGKKYLGLDEGVTTANFQQSPNNLRLIRYADVLLMFAEADMMANGGNATQAAVDAVNEVRSRADMPPFGLEMTIQDVRDERVKELALERVRYFDLLRWGLVKEKIVDNPEVKSESGGTGAYKPGREYFDLPQNEFNNNSNFEHNPGYE
ncbi:RagB/SusD family nutrient uptake outer membrane protein [Echinicola strongylocentroti]|uniref:RagB/SusD family nutrient uptake outer membrane protein n=1 Tax=Echinicola strongylocentroti TaxID=1795355 RepID=A0A2Z4IG48_9BACT|nr:RagB/SusD family nutrient uptake outer membrane protein [Echinicola strongylocentroti]AWW29576.1 RagB/SusD family nutrient uptake outer membrane protein [Echinicola strongylocentroti]